MSANVLSAAPIRFLIVDDIAENLVALEALLRRDGLEVHSARSAAEALELMLKHDYALAFLDVQMPDIDGYELAELMRGAERTRRVPIIFVTAAERNENRRFRGYEAGAVDYIFKPIDPVILKSKAEVFYSIGRQARDLERQRDELREIARHRDLAIARLRAHADNSPLALVECDCTLRVREWSRGAERLFGLAPEAMLGRRIDHTPWLAPEAVAALEGWIADGPGDHGRHSTEFVARSATGQVLHCEAYGSVVAGPGDTQLSLSVQILDVTERHRAEEIRALLIGELNHRIKNTLANVQAIARQTLRRADSLDSFGRSFSGRLHALARAHGLLSDATWSSASLDSLIGDMMRAGTLDPDNLHKSGPAVELSPENTLRLALTLHELGTNAAKYGALSVPGGQVHLDWRLTDDALELRWRESGGPQVQAPDQAGFGSILIRSCAGEEQDVTVDWHPDGVVWTLHLREGFHATRVALQPVSDIIIEPPPAPAAGPANPRVLLIEDEALVAMDLSCELGDAGIDVVKVASTLREALSAAREAQVDIALLDGNLCGEPVDEVAAALRARSIPFCFVSGYGHEHLPQDFRHVPLIQKPVRSDALLSVVRDLLARPIH